MSVARATAKSIESQLVTMLNPVELAKLVPSKRQKLIAQVAKSRAYQESELLSLHPEDHALVLLQSQNLDLILPALQHKSPQIRRIAIRALGNAWSKSTDVLVYLGGPEGIADHLNRVSFIDAKLICSQINYRYMGLDDARTKALDDVVAHLFPDIQGIQHPVSRLGSTLGQQFLSGVSPSTVFAILKRVQPSHARSFRRLLFNHPSVVGEILLMDFREVTNGDRPKFSITNLKWLVTRKAQEKAPFEGISLMKKILSTEDLDRTLLAPSASEIIALSISAIHQADSLDEKLLLITQTIGLLERMRMKSGSYFTLDVVRPFIVLIAHYFTGANSPNPFAEHLQSLGVPLIGVFNPNGVVSCLQQVAPQTRMAVLRSLHGVDVLSQQPLNIRKLTISANLLLLLPSTDGELILKELEAQTDTMFRGEREWPNPTISGLYELPFTLENERDKALTTAIRGRWAVKDNDIAKIAQLRDALQHWKNLAHRQQETEGRQLYTQALLFIAAAGGDPKSLHDAFEWTLGRFLKDPILRPVVLNALRSHKYEQVETRKDFEEHAAYGDKMLSLFIDASSKARSEPGYQTSEFSTVCDRVFDMLSSRLNFCEKFTISHEATTKLIEPLRDFFLTVEKLQLEDPGTFGSSPSFPTKYTMLSSNRLNVSKRYTSVLVRFTDKLAEARDELYTKRREGLQLSITRNESQIDISRTPWPFIIIPPGKCAKFSPEDCPFYENYLKQTVFTPLDSDSTKEPDAYYGAWEAAIIEYLDFKRTAAQQDQELLRIISHYRSPEASISMLNDTDSIDLSAYLFTSRDFMESVWKREAVCEVFLSPYFSECEEMFANGIKPLARVLSNTDEKVKGIPNWTQLIRRQTEIKAEDIFVGMFDHRKGRPRASRDFLRRLTLGAGIMHLHAIPGNRFPAPDVAVPIQDIPLTVYFTRMLYSSVLPETKEIWQWKLNNWRHNVFDAFIAGINTLAEEEIESFMLSINDIFPGDSNQTHRDKAFQILISRIRTKVSPPPLFHKIIFEILSDPERSSIHRHFFTPGVLNREPLISIRVLIQGFLDIVVNSFSESKETSTGKRPVKVTTFKLLLEIFCEPCTGYSPTEMTQHLTTLAGLIKHPSLQQALLSTTIQFIIREGQVASSSDLDSAWDIIEHLSLIACSLDGENILTDEDWSKPDLPKISINSSSPATLLTSNPYTQRSRWAKMIDNMFITQSTSTKKWIVSFMERQRATKEELAIVQEVCGPLLTQLNQSLILSYNTLQPYLRPDSWIYRMLASRSTSYLIGHTLYQFTLRLDELRPVWRREEEGSTFLQLVKLWMPIDDFRTMVRELRDYGKMGFESEIKRTLEILVDPSSMVVSPGAPERRTSNWATTLSTLQHLCPPAENPQYNTAWLPDQSISKDVNERWLLYIRPIVIWLNKYIEDVQESMRLNSAQGGLSFVPLLHYIKIICLPFPFLNLESSNKMETFADSLVNLATETLTVPSSLIPPSDFLQNIRNLVVPLIEERVELINYIVDAATRQSDYNARLFAFQIVAQFTSAPLHRKIIAREAAKKEIEVVVEKLRQDPDEGVRFIASSIDVVNLM